MGLPALGQCTYGSVVFNGPSMQTKSIQQVPRLDAANRGRTWTEYTLVLRLLIGGQAGKTDTDVATSRRVLQTPGQPFVYSDKGYGPLRLQFANVQDAIWGPLTKVLAWEPLGNGKAGWLDWQVRLAVACEGGLPTGTAAPFIELLYSMDVSNDAAGYSTRRIGVMGRVPSLRVGLGANNKELFHTADQYRERLTPPLLPGFRRTYPNWSIDEGKTVLRGEIVDEELGLNYLPPGVAVGSASQEVSSSTPGLALWQSTIDAEFELEKASAIDQFDLAGYFVGTLCKDRILATAAAIGKNSNAIVPLAFRMREGEIYGRLKAAFSLTYSFTQPFKDILGATSLWRPVPGSNWNKWAASMTGGPANPRGYAQIAIEPTDDSIVEGCGGRMPGMFTNVSELSNDFPQPPVTHIPGQTIACGRSADAVDRELKGSKWFPEPDPAHSYLTYEAWVWMEVDSGVVPVRILPIAKPAFTTQVLTSTPFGNVSPGGSGGGSRDFNNSAWDVFDAIYTKKLSEVVGAEYKKSVASVAQNILDAVTPQQRVAPLTYVFIRGHAVRYGFPVPIPALTDYCGVKPVLSCRLDMGEGYGHGIMRAANEKPIYMARWNLRYLLPGGMQAFFFPPAIPNPMLDKS